MVEKLLWAYAVNASSATVFVRHQLKAVFPMGEGGEACLPMDKTKLDANYNSILQCQTLVSVVLNSMRHMENIQSTQHYINIMYKINDAFYWLYCFSLPFSPFVLIGAKLERWPETQPSTIGSTINVSQGCRLLYGKTMAGVVAG